MAKKSLKWYGALIVLLLAVCSVSVFGACKGEKSTYFVPGTWSAENVQVGEFEIGKITLSITETYEKDDEILVSNNIEYGCFVNISGEDAEMSYATYISKYERLIGFKWLDLDWCIFGEPKKNEGNIYIVAELSVTEGRTTLGSTTITMTQE